MNRSLRLLLTAAWAAFLVVGQPLHSQRRPEPVEVQVSELQPTPVGVNITLRDVNSRKTIRMLIGFSEGQSIMQAMRGRQRERPMTHDLMKNFLDRNDWKVDRVLIRDLVGGTFRANLVLVRNDETQVFDARPSDAVAIGLRYGARIYVNEEVFEQQEEYQEEPEDRESSEPESLRL